ncbi:MAG TPA: phospholipase D-like domain-containing protein [Vicinamibacterales bacterium]|jgi:cardiolipin synthase|nr:phospholipase D-like domain-containing protein [Vicinamibacterales bacterium]
MKLIVEPDEGLRPLIAAVKRARRRIHIVIFRFDLEELEEALAKAVKRGIDVVALIAHTNKGGELSLRKLEQRMLKKGVTVNRTDDDMVRYHGKLLIVDRSAAYLLGFNYTEQDLESRSFGVITRSTRIVKELLRLFESDACRTEYTPRVRDLVISPENARSRLYTFLRKARQTLDIYDPKVADDEMLQLLEKKASQGVRIRIIGTLEKKWERAGFAAVQKLRNHRLHVRAIVRDGRRAFIGSQSLRKLELDERREVGIVIRDRKVVRKVEKVFNDDWKRAVRKKK